MKRLKTTTKKKTTTPPKTKYTHYVQNNRNLYILELWLCKRIFPVYLKSTVTPSLTGTLSRISSLTVCSEKTHQTDLQGYIFKLMQADEMIILPKQSQASPMTKIVCWDYQFVPVCCNQSLSYKWKGTMRRESHAKETKRNSWCVRKAVRISYFENPHVTLAECFEFSTVLFPLRTLWHWPWMKQVT